MLDSHPLPRLRKLLEEVLTNDLLALHRTLPVGLRSIYRPNIIRFEVDEGDGFGCGQDESTLA